MESVLAERELSYEELLHIVQLVESSSQFSRFYLKYGDTELDLRKQGAAAPDEARDAAPPASGGGASVARAGAAVAGALRPGAPGAAGSPPPAEPARGREAEVAGAVVVKSPMVGTFYRAPEPGGAAFAEVGRRVAADSTVCIIEVMKLMNSIAAGSAGVITQILVDDGEAVEFGQPLIVIDPHA